jgi:hypothetical protein
MPSEPTSVLTFRDLILDVARKLGYAYYGENGDEAIQIPQDGHDLDECKRIVNKGIRMFLADAPQPNGWRWTRPTASVTIWGTVATDSDNLVASGGYTPGTNKTELNASSDSFYESMEEKTITLTGVGSFTITDYVSAQQIRVSGDATGASFGVTWSITADGNYTLPRTFSGMYTGDITYTADTNQGVSLDWTDEAVIRQWRENVTDETGDPFWAAIRPMTSGTPRRRWELMVYPMPDEVMTVEFPFLLHFDSLVDLDEVHPAPFSHDEAVRAACLAAAERDSEDVPGPDYEYYRRVCLPNSYRIDAQSAPRKLGYFGNPSQGGGLSAIKFFNNHVRQRPNVTFNT